MNNFVTGSYPTHIKYTTHLPCTESGIRVEIAFIISLSLAAWIFRQGSSSSDRSVMSDSSFCRANDAYSRRAFSRISLMTVWSPPNISKNCSSADSSRNAAAFELSMRLTSFMVVVASTAGVGFCVRPSNETFVL